jgi:hypothetical protein
MAVWGPDGLEERSALAEEMLRLARATADRRWSWPAAVGG